jgi:hypothetical protein
MVQKCDRSHVSFPWRQARRRQVCGGRSWSVHCARVIADSSLREKGCCQQQEQQQEQQQQRLEVRGSIEHETLIAFCIDAAVAGLMGELSTADDDKRGDTGRQ